MPNQVTSMRRTRAARISVAPPTSTSRTSTTTAVRGHRLVDRDAAGAHEEQQPVGHRVEHLAHLGHLVEVAGEVAVHPVGDAQRGQQPGGRGLVLGDEQQPQEQRQARQLDQGDDVRQRQDVALGGLGGRGDGGSSMLAVQVRPWLGFGAMATLFTKIIDRRAAPGASCGAHDRAAVFTIAPIAPGHVLVVRSRRSTTGSTSTPRRPPT